MKKKKKKFSLKKFFKGFTLVELLAVIVILAIIMIIAIPSVLNSMRVAKRKSFVEFAQKVINAGEKKYIEGTSFGTLATIGLGNYYFDITKDLDLGSTGNYKGFFIIFAERDSLTYFLMIWDDEYALFKERVNADGNGVTVDDIISYQQSLDVLKMNTGIDVTSLDFITYDTLVMTQFVGDNTPNCSDAGWWKQYKLVYGNNPKVAVNLCP